MVERVLGAIFETATAPSQAYVTRWGSDPCASSDVCSLSRSLALSLALSLSRSLSLTLALLMLLYVYCLCGCAGSILVYSGRGVGGAE